MRAYLVLFGLLAISWAGMPAAGQTALVAADVLAAEERQTLELEYVLLVGTLASFAGGALGYWLGRKGGRAAWTARGPLRRRRLEILRHGETLITRYGHVAVLFAPTWVAGILRMRWPSFLVWSFAASAIWTLAGGLGGYVAGPAISKHLRHVSMGALIVLAVIGAGALVYRRLSRER